MGEEEGTNHAKAVGKPYDAPGKEGICHLRNKNTSLTIWKRALKRRNRDTEKMIISQVHPGLWVLRLSRTSVILSAFS